MNEPTNTNRPTVFMMLGRAGDVLNLLPLAKAHFDETGERPGFVVGHEFAGILDGVSYVRPLVWPGAWQDCIAAAAWARATVPGCLLLDGSVHGIGFVPMRHTASFDREAWFRAEAPAPWGRLPLVFDQRNPEREASLVRRLAPGDGPLILTTFSGVSSPFAGAGTVLAALRNAFPGTQFVDVSNLRCDRLFDLLGLFERAAVLVANDSSPMHLAHAVPSLPVVMLTQDAKPSWHRSSWRPQHAARLFYSEATIDPACVVRAVDSVFAGTRPRRFVRVSAYLGAMSDETSRRVAVARQSWAEEMNWSGCWREVLLTQLPRDSRCLGDPQPCPFSRDLIDAALRWCERMDDVVVLSNADVGIAPGLTGWLTEAFIRGGAAFTHRWDRSHAIGRPPLSEAEVCAGEWYPGSDVWAFTKGWWLAWGDRFPDMVIGREAGDMVLRHVVKHGGGVEIPGSVWHERHPSFWEQPGNRESLPSNVHNRKLAHEFLARFGGDWNDGRPVYPSGIMRRRRRARQ